MAANNDSSKNNVSGRERIEDYGLVRLGTEPNSDLCRFIEPYLGGGPFNWESSKITLPGHEDHLNWYSMSKSHDAYVTLCVGLTDGDERGDPRLTDMRYRDMTIDNIVASGGEGALSSLRFLATRSIFNQSARDTIESCFRARGLDFMKPGSLEVKPGDECYSKCVKVNPFARGHRCMLRHCSDATDCALIKRLIFVNEGIDPRVPSFMNPTLHMICELERPDQSWTSLG